MLQSEDKSLSYERSRVAKSSGTWAKRCAMRQAVWQLGLQSKNWYRRWNNIVSYEFIWI